VIFLLSKGKEMTKLFYTTLGVDENASADVIKKAFRRLSLQLHPDRNPNQSAADVERYKAIVLAYDILGKEDKRQKYDQGEINDQGNAKVNAAPPPSAHQNKQDNFPYDRPFKKDPKPTPASDPEPKRQSQSQAPKQMPPRPQPAPRPQQENYSNSNFYKFQKFQNSQQPSSSYMRPSKLNEEI
jgi:DnaJ-class molecular chaperone